MKFFYLLILIGMPVFSSAASAEPMASGQRIVKGVSIPLFSHDKSAPSAYLKIGSLATGARRVGFFRVGILPELIGHDVKIEFAGDSMDAETLMDLFPALNTLAKLDHVEFLKLSIYTGKKAEPDIRAGSAIIVPGRQWELADIVTIDGKTMAKGRLTISGNVTPHLISSK